MRSDPLVLLHGTTEPLQEFKPLRAGHLTLMFGADDVRAVRLGEEELVSRVYSAVRDENWGTVPGELSGLTLEERADSFALRFSSTHRSSGTTLVCQIGIVGSEDGSLVFSFDATAEGTFVYNRIGLCIHHPWNETRGARFQARTGDGDLEGAFPDLIGPQWRENGVYVPLFPSFSSLEIERPRGGWLSFEFEGDEWETEDQRNWTDASFKSYPTPIALPSPRRLRSGETLSQRITVSCESAQPTPQAVGPSDAELTLATVPVAHFPAIGIGADRDPRHFTDEESRLFRCLAPRHLRADLRIPRQDWPRHLEIAQANAAAIGASLELALLLDGTESTQLDQLASLLEHGPNLSSVFVFAATGRIPADDEATPTGLVELVRGRLGSTLERCTVMGGTEMNFTEVNRRRPPTASWDGLVFSVTPQIHAFTDLDILENAVAQGEVVRSAHQLLPGKPIAVSPITLRPRHNFHASDLNLGAAIDLSPTSIDPRQTSLLGAAWTAASLKYLVEADVSSLTYYESTGQRGLVVTAENPSVVPSFHVLADACAWAGADVLPVASSRPGDVVGLAVATREALHVIVASTSTTTQRVRLLGVTGEPDVRRLNLDTAGTALTEPLAYRARREPMPSSGGPGLVLSLDPFETVTLVFPTGLARG